MGFVSLPETADRIEGRRLRLVGMIGSSTDDWDRYESLHWRAIEDWLAEQPDDDSEMQETRSANDEHKKLYLERRESLGWAIFVARKPG